MELLRPNGWFEFHDVQVGETLFLNLPELGAFGDATVVKVGPCPKIAEGEGQVVTGRFIHESDGDLLDLHIEGEPHPIGCTANHPFWSETRQKFRPAGELKPGETLQTANGLATLDRIEARGKSKKFYNLEVHRERVYRVGALGTFVHNNYTQGPYRVRQEKNDGIFRLLDSKGNTIAEGRSLRELVAQATRAGASRRPSLSLSDARVAVNEFPGGRSVSFPQSATEPEVIIPGPKTNRTPQFRQAVRELQDASGKGNNYRTNSYDEARSLLKAAFGGMDRRKTGIVGRNTPASSKYFEVHRNEFMSENTP